MTEVVADGGFRPPPYPYDRLDGLRVLAEALPGGASSTVRSAPPVTRRRRGGAGAGGLGDRARLPALGRGAGPAPGGRRLAPAPLRGGARPSSSSQPAWAPRRSWPRPRSTSGCATPPGTRCSTRPSPTPPTPWGPPSPAAGPWPCPRPPPTAPASTWAPSAGRGRAGPALVGQLAGQPLWWPHRPGRGGRLGPTARGPGLLRRVLHQIHLGRTAALGAPDGDRGRGGRALPLQAVEPGRGAGRLLRGGPRARRLPALGPPARRADGGRAGPGGGRGGPGRRRARGGPARPLRRAAPVPVRRASAAGCPVGLPAGGFYLWGPVPDAWGDAWALAEDLARVAGLLVSPGDLYGRPGGAT